MTISLGKNIGFALSDDKNIMVLEPTIDSLKKKLKDAFGESDEKIILYDFLQILAESANIDVTMSSSESKVK